MSNLKDTTWVFNDEIYFMTAEANFYDNGEGPLFVVDNEEYSNMICNFAGDYLVYGKLNGSRSSEIPVYQHSSSGWLDNSYKTITFVAEPTRFLPDEETFMMWLEISATKQTGLLNISGAKVLYDDLRTRLNTKTDKVTSATNNNFAALDANGNLKDSGHKHGDYLTSYDPILVKHTFNVDATDSTPFHAFTGPFPTYMPVNKDYAHCYVADYYLSNPSVFTGDIEVSYTSSTDTLNIFAGVKPNSPASTITITLCKQETATTTMYLNTGYQYTEKVASTSKVQSIIDIYGR